MMKHPLLSNRQNFHKTISFTYVNINLSYSSVAWRWTSASGNLNTNKERNERVHNFYKKNKFEQVGIIRKNGREVSEYLLDLKEE